MKCIRVVEYEGSPEDLTRALERTLLSAQPVVSPGDDVPGVGKINAAPGAPQVTIRLMSERFE